MSLGLLSHVEFKKRMGHPVDVRGQGPYSWSSVYKQYSTHTALSSSASALLCPRSSSRVWMDRSYMSWMSFISRSLADIWASAVRLGSVAAASTPDPSQGNRRDLSVLAPPYTPPASKESRMYRIKEYLRIANKE